MLSEAEVTQLESSLLPALERHHLRLLAHGLRTLQEIAGQRRGPPPPAEVIAAWAASQPAVAADPRFRRAFVEQLQGLAGQLLGIGASLQRPALELELDDLVTWARRRADERITAPPREAGPPPG
ncbi:MAG: hypothetical protein VKI81_09970 [Synechococcaceae cyanobacterium]|nr:hypothetical protein [Synechococcaceae cyanobacterium]